MNWTPHPYQERAIKLMLNQAPAGLFLDPGMGKTAIVLAAFDILKSQKLVKDMLIVVPLRPMYSTWPAEIIKWDDFNHLTVSLLHGPKKDDALEEDADLYVINPDGFAWLLKKDVQVTKKRFTTRLERLIKDKAIDVLIWI